MLQQYFAMKLFLLAGTMAASSAHAQVQPVFIRSSPLWSKINLDSNQSPFPFGISEIKLDKLIDAVVLAMNEEQFIAQAMSVRSAERIANEIKAKVASVTRRTQGETVPEFVQQWLLAEGVCEFVRATCSYDHSDRERTQPPATQIARNRFDYIYQMDRPSAVCWGIAVSTRDIARAAGLRCDFVNGISRGLGAPAPKQSERNHGVVVFTFPGGVEVPADVSSHITDFQNNKRPAPRKKVNSWMVLPRRKEAWELFLATFNADVGEDIEISGDKQNKHKLLSMTYQEWARTETRNLRPLLLWLQRFEHGSAR